MHHRRTISNKFVAARAVRACALISLVHCAACDMPVATDRGRTIFVDSASTATDPDGSSPQSAFRTIQDACDIVKAGETIVIAPGVYFEHVQLRQVGTRDRPILIKADEILPGRVIITGANRAIREGKVRWDVVDPELGLYVISHPTLESRPARVLYSGTDLAPYPTVEELRRFSFLEPDGYPGPSQGFSWDDERHMLFVRLDASGRYGGRDPNRHVMAVSPSTGTGFAGLGVQDVTHFNIDIDSPGNHQTESNVILDGLTFETPGVAGVFIASAGAVTVRNCWCFGCRTLVSGRRFYNDNADYTQTTNNVLIENCEFTQYPAFDDMVEVIQRPDQRIRDAVPPEHSAKQIYWWHRKGAPDGSIGGPKHTYEVGIASAVGRSWTFRNNFVHDAFEGLSTWSLSTSLDTIVEGNRFERIVDNAIESENHASNLIIRDNIIIDVFEPFSWQPLSGSPWPGPVSIHHNIVSTSPQIRGLWREAGWLPSVFKIGASRSNWDVASRSWMRGVSQDSVTVPSRGFNVWQNTIFAPGHRLVGRVGEAIRYDNFAFRNNIIVVDDFNGGDIGFRDVGITYDQNVVFMASPRDSVGASIAAGPRGRVLTDVQSVGLRDPDNLDVSLKADSAAIASSMPIPGHERSGYDAGALQRREVLRLWQVGPSSDQR